MACLKERPHSQAVNVVRQKYRARTLSTACGYCFLSVVCVVVSRSFLSLTKCRGECCGTREVVKATNGEYYVTRNF